MDLSSLTECMRRNLCTAEKSLKKMLALKTYLPEDVAVFPLDRAEGKKYARQFTKNCCPTLTTSNKYLFVCSLHDLHLPRVDREYCRFIHPSERMVLQGFPAETLHGSPDLLRVKASGNAYPAFCQHL